MPSRKSNTGSVSRVPPPGGGHISSRALAYIEGRLPARDRRDVERHLALCAACRAEVDDLRYLGGVLAAAPRVLDASLDGRRAALWPLVWTRVAAGPSPVIPPRLHGRAAGAMALALCVMMAVGLLVSPFQRQALAAAADPPLAVIQTPAQPRSSLTSAPAGSGAGSARASTATLVLHLGQTPAPNPDPRLPNS